MTFSIAGKTAIVTGAANGVGLAIARNFVDHGANVMFADMDEKRLIDELGKSEDDANVSSRYFAGDLREKLTMANLLSATLDAFDRVDILINGARCFALSDPLDPADGSVEEAIDQNLISGLRLSQLVARRMITQAGDTPEKGVEAGCIVSLASVAARVTQPELLGWSIASAGIEAMTRSLAMALAPHQIRVNAIAVGSVLTASLRDQMNDHADYRDAIIAGTPMKRLGTLAEVAGAAQFLASPAAGFMTGQVMTIDGGRTLRDPVQRPAH